MSNDPDKLAVAFFGTPDFAVPTLESLIRAPGFDVRCVVTQPDRPAGRGKELRPSPVKSAALAASIPVLQPESVKKDGRKFIEELSKFGPFDISVVIAFGQILPEKLLSLPKCGSVNLHASILPRWRGAAPIQRAIMAGDKSTGVCLMRMEAGLDTGPVYAEAKLPVLGTDNFGTLHDKLAELSASLAIQKLRGICTGELAAAPQESTGVTYAKKIEEPEAKINWELSAAELNNLIRGLSPIPGAFTSFKGKRLKIYSAEVKKPMSGRAFNPGEVQAVDKNMLEVQCGVDSLSVTEVQLEGKQRMPIGIFLNGHSISVGTKLGD